MAEIFRAYHAVGGSSPSSPEHLFTLPVSQINLGPSAFAMVPIQRVDNVSYAGAANGSGTVFISTSAITGSTSLQSSVPVSSTAFIDQTANTYLIIDGGTSSQEVVQAAYVDATHISAIFLRNHLAGAPIQVVYSCFTKYLLGDHVSVSGSLSNIGFIRYNSLAANVYDQYRLLGSPGSLDYEPDNFTPWYSGSSYASTVPLNPVPQYSSGSVSTTFNPTNAVTLAAGPITTSGGYYANVQIQILFTSTPEPYPNGDYRCWWDH